MNTPVHNRTACAFLIVLVVLGLVAAGAGSGAAASTPQPPQSIEGIPPVLIRAGHGEAPFRVPRPAGFSQARVQSATFTVNYLAGGTKDAFGSTCYAWPESAKTAFSYAANIWGSLVTSAVPITIDACWTDLGPGILGQSGVSSYYRNFPGATVANTWYSVALANALSGTDWNGTTAEMNVSYSKGFDWYFGTDGNTPIGQYDLTSVVLHEICHGLGFSGFMWVYGGRGYWGWNNSPAIYDRFTENGAGQALISFSNGSTALAAQLTSNNVYFDGPNANAANGGAPAKLYTPSTWQSGSSYSHLAEDYNSTPNALMTYALDDGESIHDPGPVGLGILRDVGWVIGVSPTPHSDVQVVKQVRGGPYFRPGDPITFTLTISNGGAVAASQVVVTDVVPSQVLTPTYTSTLVLTRTGALTYVWNVGPLGAGASGVITIYGWLDPNLANGLVFTNTAIVSDPQDDTPGNNVSPVRVSVGLYSAYLPLVLRLWPSLPDTPVLDAIDNLDGDANYAVSWSAAPLADTYALEEDNDVDFSNPATVYSGPLTSTSITDKSPGMYYYRVKAANPWGHSEWSNVQSVSVQPLWTTIMSEDFEGAFPGVWNVLDNNGANYGTYTWEKRTCRPYAGSYSGWGVGGGANGAALGCSSNYPDNADSWMVYGPFDLSDATAGYLGYKLWLHSELNHDSVCRLASTNGSIFYGWCNSGDSQGWTDQVLDLTNVPTLGNLMGQPNVWIALKFSSDSATHYAEGGFVDNIVLRKCGFLTCATGAASTPDNERLAATPTVVVLER